MHARRPSLNRFAPRAAAATDEVEEQQGFSSLDEVLKGQGAPSFHATRLGRAKHTRAILHASGGCALTNTQRATSARYHAPRRCTLTPVAP